MGNVAANAVAVGADSVYDDVHVLLMRAIAAGAGAVYSMYTCTV